MKKFAIQCFIVSDYERKGVLQASAARMIAAQSLLAPSASAVCLTPAFSAPSTSAAHPAHAPPRVATPPAGSSKRNRRSRPPKPPVVKREEEEDLDEYMDESSAMPSPGAPPTGGGHRPISDEWEEAKPTLAEILMGTAAPVVKPEDVEVVPEPVFVVPSLSAAPGPSRNFSATFAPPASSSTPRTSLKLESTVAVKGAEPAAAVKQEPISVEQQGKAEEEVKIVKEVVTLDDEEDEYLLEDEDGDTTVTLNLTHEEEEALLRGD